MTLSSHHELRFDVIDVVPKACKCHWFNCDKHFIQRQNEMKSYIDILKMIFFCVTNNNDIEEV